MEWCLGGTTLLERKEPSKLKGEMAEHSRGRGEPWTTLSLIKALTMASFSYFLHFGLTIADFKPELPVPGTSSDFPGVQVADSIEKKRETRKGV